MKTACEWFWPGAILAALIILESHGYAEGRAIPYLGLQEENGHLFMESSLPPGTTHLQAFAPSGMLVQAIICVSKDGADGKLVRLFRLNGETQQDDSRAKTSVNGRLMFTVTLTPSTSPGHYTIRYYAKDANEGAIHEVEAKLVRMCCGYYLSFREGTESSQIARGTTLRELKLHGPHVYNHFDRLARSCNCPGFELVPTSHNGTTAVEQVIDERRPHTTIANRGGPLPLIREFDENVGGVRRIIESEARRSTEQHLAKADAAVSKILDGNAKPSASQFHAQPKLRWVLSEDLGAPAGVVFDRSTSELYVSQISGEGDKKDGVGVVSRLDLKGNVLKMWWISGLNAPKGMTLDGRTLWVTDIDELVAIDIPAARIRRKIAIEGAKFLTGVAVDGNGAVYVGDMLTSRIYRVTNGRAAIFAEGRDLESPGALLFSNDRLLVSGWGYTTDYSTAAPGSLYFLDLKTRKQSSFMTARRGNWLGLSGDGETGYFAANFAGGVFRIDSSGRISPFIELSGGAAGLIYVPEAKLLVVTETRANRISGYDLAMPAGKN
jgi:sugar lactone lactonase YvrE